MKYAVVALIACTGVCSSFNAALAQQTHPGESGAAGASTQSSPRQTISNPDKMVCKSEAVIGSRFPKKICMTTAQWLQQEQDAKKMLERLQGARLPDQG
jgi:hypothetical protein